MSTQAKQSDEVLPWKVRTRLKIKHLVAIDQLAKHQNVGAAAREMSLSQPAVSKLLQEAERALGTTLFARSRRGVAPTLVGDAMIFRARQILNDLDAAREDLTLVSQGASGKIRLGSFLVAAPILMPRAIDLFLQLFPKALISVEEGTRDRLIPALVTGEIDLVIGRVIEEDIPASVVSHLLYSEEACVVCGPTHPLANLRRIAAKALTEYQWILPPFASSLRHRLNAVLGQAGTGAARICIESGSVFTTVAMLRARPLLAIIPAAVAEYFARIAQLRILRPAIDPIEVPVGTLKRILPDPSPLVEAFSECLQRASREMHAPKRTAK